MSRWKKALAFTLVAGSLLTAGIWRALNAVGMMPLAAAKEAVMLDDAFNAMLGLTVPLYGFLLSAFLAAAFFFRQHREGEEGVPFEGSKGRRVEILWVGVSFYRLRDLQPTNLQLVGAGWTKLSWISGDSPQFSEFYPAPHNLPSCFYRKISGAFDHLQGRRAFLLGAPVPAQAGRRAGQNRETALDPDGRGFLHPVVRGAVRHGTYGDDGSRRSGGGRRVGSEIEGTELVGVATRLSYASE